MNTAVAKRNQQAIEPAPTRGLAQYSLDELDVLKTQITYPEITDTELTYFLSAAQALGLNPLENPRLIYAIPRKTGNEVRMTIQLSVDGYVKLAEERGDVESMSEIEFCVQAKADTPAEWRAIWLPGQLLIAARVTIKRRSRSYATTYSIRKGAYEVSNNPFWRDKPDIMLAAAVTRYALKRSGAIYAMPPGLQTIVGAEDAVIDIETGEIALTANTRRELHARADHATVHQAVIDNTPHESLKDCNEADAQTVLEALNQREED